jgi:hypothetical protein
MDYTWPKPTVIGFVRLGFDSTICVGTRGEDNFAAAEPALIEAQYPTSNWDAAPPAANEDKLIGIVAWLRLC